MPDALGPGSATPGTVRALGWAVRLRCARCGSGGLFHRWFRMVEDCPRCGLHFEREPGYWAGALAVNIISVGGLFAIVFVALLVATVPRVPMWILAVVVPIAALGPIVWYPFSKSIWVAVDRALLQRLDPNERLDEQV